jgi:hypothetical protein
MMTRIKSEPNPIGEENFLFLNAFNEWGEGNVLEPSERWGTGSLDALGEAMEYVEQHVPWAPQLTFDHLTLASKANDTQEEIDVCIVIRQFEASWPWGNAFTLAQTLDSLRALKNPRWRAVVAGMYVNNQEEERVIDVNILLANDPRIVNAEVPADVKEETAKKSDGSRVTDWVVANLKHISSACNQARYLLITNATNRYEPDSFDEITKTSADIIGLNFESLEVMSLEDGPTPGSVAWNDRCERFENGKARKCLAASRDSPLIDLGAVLLNLKKWQSEGIQLSASDDGSTMLQELSRQSLPWTWASSAADSSKSCHLLHAGAYTICTRSGRHWVDLPESGPYKAGCYSGYQLQSTYFVGSRIPEQWDYARFDEKPHCIRFSQRWYEDVTKEAKER